MHLVNNTTTAAIPTTHTATVTLLLWLLILLWLQWTKNRNSDHLICYGNREGDNLIVPLGAGEG